MNVSDIVQLRSDGGTMKHLMTIEDMKTHTVTCVYFRDGIIRREEIATHCLAVVAPAV